MDSSSPIPRIGKDKWKQPSHLRGKKSHQIVNCRDVRGWLERLKKRQASPNEISSFFRSYLKFNQYFIRPDAEGLAEKIIIDCHEILQKREKIVAFA